MRFFRVVAAVLFAALLPMWSYAQTQGATGTFEVTVRSADGPLPGATVAIRNAGTGFEKAGTTDANGRFRAPLMPLGAYDVTVSLDGFATVVRDGLSLSVAEVVSLAVTLSSSTVAEEIVVTGDTPLIETANVANTVQIDQAAVEGLPNNGRNFLELTLLTPGVAIVQGPDGDEITINGQKGIQNNISVDGADFNNPFFGEQRGGQRPAFTFNLDAVQELVVIADGAPAEFGRASAGFVNVVTKSGTNTLAGSANLFYQNDSMSTAAKRPDGSSEPKYEGDRGQLGFTLGGPIKRDKLFFFLAADAQQGSALKQRDPNRIEPRVVAAFAALGSPNENAAIDRGDDALVGLIKLDWNASASNLFTLRANSTDSEQENGTFDVDSWGVSANAVEKASSYSIGASLVSTLGSGWLNEARLQYAREDRPRPYDGPIVPSTGRPLPDTAFDFGSGYRFGMPFFIPVEYYDQRWQINESMTWLSGNHTVKAGLEYNETSAFQTFVGFANGRYIFGSTDGFLNFLANPNYVECSDGSSSQTGQCPAGTSITGPVLLYLQQAGVGGLSVEEAGTQTIIQKEPAIYLQDTWQPASNVTIALGLRWEAQDQPDPITPSDEVFYAPFIGRTVTNATGTYEFPSDGTIPDDDDMYQPRLGITWDPSKTGNTVLRFNAGIYYARIPGLTLASTRSTNGSRGQSLFRNSELTPILGPVPAYPNLIPASEVGDPFRPDVFVFDKDFENPKTTTYAFAVEQTIAPRTVALLRLNYSDTDNLTRFVNRNDPLFGSPWSTGLGADGSNGVGTLTVVESSARSEYRGATIGLRRDSDVFSYNVYYTYSKDKSDDDNERDPFSFRYARVTDLDAEWGYSDRDQRHRGNAWVLWRAPYGIDVNARYSYRSAQPVSITASGAIAGTPQDRINPDGTVTQRNLGRKDNAFSSFDLRVSKQFDLGGLDLELIVEGFNLTNEENFRNPLGTSLIFNFDGTVQSGLGDPRQFQVGARLRF